MTENPKPQAVCCVCGDGEIVYHNYADQPFCRPCADCRCGQNPCERTGVNDPAVSAEAAGRSQQYAIRIECAIGLYGGAGGSEGVKAASDAVLAVRDEELDAVRRRAIGHVEIIGDVRDWARKRLTPEQQEQLRDVLSRRRKAERPTPEPTDQYDRIMQAVGSVYDQRGWPADVRALEAMSDAVEALVAAEVAAEQAVSADLRERLRVTSDTCFAATCDAQDAREAIARVQAAVSDLAGERLIPGDMRKAVVTAIERPAEQSILRPAHEDGTPYQYNEIVVDGWSHCDGCRTWIRGYTGSNPHRCDANWRAVRKEVPDA